MEYVGKDSRGNTYYYVFRPEATAPPKRVYRNDDPTNVDIPPSWQAWLTGTRTEPPQDHEVDFPTFAPNNMTSAEEEELFVPHKGVNHAAAPASGTNVKFKDKSEPESKGDTFQPGSWSPK